MTFLAIDTSGDYAVLALANEAAGGAITAVSIFEGRRTLSQRLLGRIDSLLNDNGMTLDDLTAFAVGIGPGSFTGVRVGVTTAKTLAQATGKPLVGIGTLDAHAAVWEGTRYCYVVPILPSRRDEAYAAIYSEGRVVEPPFAESYAQLGQRLRAFFGVQEVVICGHTELIGDEDVAGVRQAWCPPEGLAKLAAVRLAAGDRDDPLALTPLYVVPPTITMPKDKGILPGS